MRHNVHNAYLILLLLLSAEVTHQIRPKHTRTSFAERGRCIATVNTLFLTVNKLHTIIWKGFIHNNLVFVKGRTLAVTMSYSLIAVGSPHTRSLATPPSGAIVTFKCVAVATFMFTKSAPSNATTR